MTRDEITPIDEHLLAALLAAEAAVAGARADGVEPGLPAGEDLTYPPIPGLTGLVDLIQRLQPEDPSTKPLTATDPADAVAMPAVLGRFEVIREVGRGGFGVVYLARDPLLGRDVALKVPRAEVLITPEARRRFLREGRAAAGLDHPHIIPVFEAGEGGPFAYIVSAYCEGPTLSAWLRERTGPVPPRAAARLLVDLAGAVQHAHDRGVLHRDLKPSNILLQDGGPAADPDVPTLRITDFGLARIIEESATDEETRSGVPFGSPPYMAPEQAAGKRREIGPAADVYALGATLYEILSGRPPFQGDSYLETLGQVLTLDPVPPRALRPGLPRDLETICLKCLGKSPDRRYASAGDLREDLERFRAGEPIRARPISARLRAAKWVRRRPLHAAALVLGGLLASMLVGGLVLRDAMIQDYDRQLEREIVRADAHARLARRHLQAFQLRQAQQALEARQVERAQDILGAIEADRERSDAAEDPGDPGFARHYLMRLARRDLVVLSDRQSERVSTIALSPDGRTLATGDDDGTIRLRDPETGRVRMTLAGHRLLVGHLAFSPDGRRLASTGHQNMPSPLRGEALLWDTHSSRLRARLEGFSDRDVDQVAWDARGENLWEVSWTEGGRARLGSWDVRSDPSHPRLRWNRFTEEARRPRADDDPIAALEGPGPGFRLHDLEEAMGLGWTGAIDRDQFAASSPDGRLLAVGVEHRIALWDVRAGRERARFELPPQEAFLAIRFSPDGRYLMAIFVSGRCEICELRTGDIRIIPPAVMERRPSVACAFSHDGRLLALNDSKLGGPQPTRIWELDPRREVGSYPGTPGGSELLFGRDHGSLILRNDWAAIRWNYAMAQEPNQSAGHADEAWSAAFSPVGSVLATGSDDTAETQTIKLWDADTGRPIRGWNAGDGTVAALAFAPRGGILASAQLGKPGAVRLWDPTNGQPLAVLDGHTDSVRSVAFNPDGTMLASSSSDRTIRLWDVAFRRCFRILSDHTDTVRQVAFSPDGSLLASASNDFTVRIWDARSGSLLRTVAGVANYAAVAFAPDGRSLAAADERGMVSVWDVASGDLLQRVAAEHDFPLCLAYSPDGRSLAVAGKTRTIRLWDPVTGQELLTLDGHKGQVNGLAFSPDGSTLASCGHDGAVRLWRAGR